MDQPKFGLTYGPHNASYDAESFTEDQSRLNDRRKEAAKRVLFDTDITRLDDANAAALYRSVTKNYFGLEDTDGYMCFKDRRSTDMKRNIEMLRDALSGKNLKPLFDPRSDEYEKADRTRKLEMAREGEGWWEAAKRKASGWMGLALHMGPTSTITGSPVQTFQEETDEERKARETADEDKLLNDYEQKLAKNQPLITLLSYKDMLTDRAGWILTKSVSEGQLDTEALATIPDKEQQRRVIAGYESVMGDARKVNILGFDTDISTGTAGDRVQMALYGAQNFITSLWTDTKDYLVDWGTTLALRYIHDERERKQVEEMLRLESTVRMANERPLPKGGFWGEAVQTLAENWGWAAPLIYGRLFKALRAAEGSKLAKIAAVGDKAYDMKQAYKFNEGSAALASVVSRYTKALETVNKAKRLPGVKMGIFDAQIAGARLVTFSMFAKEFVDTCDAQGISREASMPLSVIVGVVNDRIENIEVPFFTEDIEKQQLRSIGMHSLVEHLKRGELGKYLGNRLGITIPAGAKVAMSEGAIEEPLQQLVIEHFEVLAEDLDMLRDKDGKELSAANKKIVKDQLERVINGADLGTYAETVTEMIPAGAGYLVTTGTREQARDTAGRMWDRAKKRRTGKIDQIRSFEDEGLADTVERHKAAHLQLIKHELEKGVSPEKLEYENTPNVIVDEKGVTHEKKPFEEKAKDKGEVEGEGAGAVEGVEDVSAAAKRSMEERRSEQGDLLIRARSIYDKAGGKSNAVSALMNEMGIPQELAEMVADTFADADLEVFCGNRKVKSWLAGIYGASLTDRTFETLGGVKGSIKRDSERGITIVKFKTGTDGIGVPGVKNGEFTIAYKERDSYLQNDNGTIDFTRLEKDIEPNSQLGKSYDEVRGENEKPWAELSPLERKIIAVTRANGLHLPGDAIDFKDDETGEETKVPVDSIIFLAQGRLKDVAYQVLPKEVADNISNGARATGWTLYHETWHELWKFQSMMLSEDEKKALADQVGVDTTKDGWESALNEAMAYEFERWGSGQYVSPKLDGKFKQYQAYLGKLLEGIVGKSEDVEKRDKDGKPIGPYALADFYRDVMEGRMGSANMRIPKLSTKSPEAKGEGDKRLASVSDGKIPVAPTAEQTQAAEEAEGVEGEGEGVAVGEGEQKKPVETRAGSFGINEKDESGNPKPQSVESGMESAKKAIKDKVGEGNYEEELNKILDAESEYMAVERLGAFSPKLKSAYPWIISEWRKRHGKNTSTMRRASGGWDYNDVIFQEMPKKYGGGYAIYLLEVVNADDIYTSMQKRWDRPDLQNRDTTTVDSMGKVEEIGAGPVQTKGGLVNPNPEGNTILVTRDNRVIRGHHTSQGIIVGYEKGTGNQYRADTIEEAESRGLEMGDRALQKPVIVAKLVAFVDAPEMTDAKLAIIGNETEIRANSKAAQAKIDATKLESLGTIKKLKTNARGQLVIDDRKTHEALLGFFNSSGQQNAIRENSRHPGEFLLTEEGRERIENAILAYLFQTDDNADALIENLIDRQEDLDITNEMRGIIANAMGILDLAERRKAYDIRNELRNALIRYTEWREQDEDERLEKNKTVDQWLVNSVSRWKAFSGQDGFDFGGAMSADKDDSATRIANMLAKSRPMRVGASKKETQGGIEESVRFVRESLAKFVERANNVNLDTDDLLNEPPATKEKLVDISFSVASAPKITIDKKFLDAEAKKFGTTKKPHETQAILPDGRGLKGVGVTMMGVESFGHTYLMDDIKATVPREIEGAAALKDDAAMAQYLEQERLGDLAAWNALAKTRVIRVTYGGQGLQFFNAPTKEQADALWDFVEDALKDMDLDETLIVDFSDEWGETPITKQYSPKTSPRAVIDDAKGYYENGEKPVNAVSRRNFSVAPKHFRDADGNKLMYLTEMRPQRGETVHWERNVSKTPNDNYDIRQVGTMIGTWLRRTKYDPTLAFTVNPDNRVDVGTMAFLNMRALVGKTNFGNVSVTDYTAEDRDDIDILMKGEAVEAEKAVRRILDRHDADIEAMVKRVKSSGADSVKVLFSGGGDRRLDRALARRVADRAGLPVGTLTKASVVGFSGHVGNALVERVKGVNFNKGRVASVETLCYEKTEGYRNAFLDDILLTKGGVKLSEGGKTDDAKRLLRRVAKWANANWGVMDLKAMDGFDAVLNVLSRMTREKANTIPTGEFVKTLSMYAETIDFGKALERENRKTDRGPVRMINGRLSFERLGSDHIIRVGTVSSVDNGAKRYVRNDGELFGTECGVWESALMGDTDDPEAIKAAQDVVGANMDSFAGALEGSLDKEARLNVIMAYDGKSNSNAALKVLCYKLLERIKADGYGKYITVSYVAYRKEGGTVYANHSNVESIHSQNIVLMSDAGNGAAMLEVANAVKRFNIQNGDRSSKVIMASLTSEEGCRAATDEALQTEGEFGRLLTTDKKALGYDIRKGFVSEIKSLVREEASVADGSGVRRIPVDKEARGRLASDEPSRPQVSRVGGTTQITLPPRGEQKRGDTNYPSAGGEVSALGEFSIGGERKKLYRDLLENKRPDLVVEKVDKILSEIERYNNPKKEKLAIHWIVTGAIVLPEDEYKVDQAMKTAERAKVDPFQFDSPYSIVTQYDKFVPKGPIIDPDTVPELKNKMVLGDGITLYDVDETVVLPKEIQDQADASSDEIMRREYIKSAIEHGEGYVSGQVAMRKIINSHWGKDARPWCLLRSKEDGSGELDKDARYYWDFYSALPKRVAFKDGKLLAFMATGVDYTTERRLKHEKDFEIAEKWWDRNDESFDGVPVTGRIKNDSLGRHGTLVYDTKTGDKRLVGKLYRGNPEKGVYEEWEDEETLVHRRSKDESGKTVLSISWYQDGSVQSVNVHDGAAIWYRDGSIVSYERLAEGKRYSASFYNGNVRTISHSHASASVNYYVETLWIGYDSNTGDLVEFMQKDGKDEYINNYMNMVTRGRPHPYKREWVDEDGRHIMLRWDGMSRFDGLVVHDKDGKLIFEVSINVNDWVYDAHYTSFEDFARAYKEKGGKRDLDPIVKSLARFEYHCLTAARMYSESAKKIAPKRPTIPALPGLKDDEIHFSVAGMNAVPTAEGRRKDLIALHNITEKDLRGALALGGFAMPSVAVVKDTIGHTEYGPISLLMKPSAIDPKASAYNRVYSGDAWTPSFPEVFRHINRDVKKRANDTLRGLLEKGGVADVYQNEWYNFEDDDALNREFGEYTHPSDGLARRGLAKAAYLVSKGEPITRIIKPDGEVDIWRTKDLVDRTVKVFDTAYLNWLEGLYKGIVDDAGIFNGLDYIDATGRRRTWYELHDAMTLANVVKAMRREQAQGKAFGGTGFEGAAARLFDSLDDVIANEGQLKDVPEDEYQEMKRNLTVRYDTLVREYASTQDAPDSNMFFVYDEANNQLLDVYIEKRGNEMAMLKPLNEYGFHANEDFVRRFVALMREAGRLYTRYFEAKPMRAVMFDEVAAAIVPSAASEDVKAGLANVGIKVYTYRANDPANRLDVTNEAADETGVSFSVAPARNVGERMLGIADTYKDAQKISARGISAGITSIEGHELDPGAIASLGNMLNKTADIISNQQNEVNTAYDPSLEAEDDRPDFSVANRKYTWADYAHLPSRVFHPTSHTHLVGHDHPFTHLLYERFKKVKMYGDEGARKMAEDMAKAIWPNEKYLGHYLLGKHFGSLEDARMTVRHHYRPGKYYALNDVTRDIKKPIRWMYVHNVDKHNTNMIPLAFAERLADVFGGTVDASVAKRSDERNTGAKMTVRAGRNFEWSGPVDKDAAYFIVDDVWTTGSTTVSLLEYLHGLGADVRGIVTLATAANGDHIVPERRDWALFLKKARMRSMKQVAKVIGFDPEKLTGSEAYVYGVKGEAGKGGLSRWFMYAFGNFETNGDLFKEAGAPSGSFSVAKPTWTNDDDMIVAALAAGMAINPKRHSETSKRRSAYGFFKAHRKETERLVMKAHPEIANDYGEVMRIAHMLMMRAQMESRDIIKDIERGVSESEIVRRLPKKLEPIYRGELAGQRKAGADIMARGIKAREMVEERWQKRVDKAVKVQVGVEPELFEQWMGVDLTETLLKALSNPKEMKAAPNKGNQPITTEPPKEEDLALGGAGDGGEARRALTVETIEEPRRFAQYMMGRMEQYWRETNGLGTSSSLRVWSDAVAFQFARKTAQNVFSKIVKSIVYSGAREVALNNIAKFQYAQTPAALESLMTFVGEVIHARHIRETKEAMLEELNTLLKTKLGASGRFKPDREELRRKVTAELEMRARVMRQYMWLSKASAAEEAARLMDEANKLYGKYAEAEKDVEQSRRYLDIQRRLGILREFGALKEKTLGEIEDALNYWKDAESGSHEQILLDMRDREARTMAAADALAKAVANPNAKNAVEAGLKANINNYLVGHMGFVAMLQDMTRYATGEAKKTADAVIGYIAREIQKSGDRTNWEASEQSDAFMKAVEAIYHRPFQKVMAEMNAEDDRFAPFMGEHGGKKDKPTKARAMQLLVSLLQAKKPGDDYYENAVRHDRHKQAPKIAELLSAEDMNMIAWIGRWYENNRQGLSAVAQALFGMGVYSENANYFPVKMKMEPQGLESAEGVGWTIFPRALTPRVRNERDFDTRADIFSMWQSRMQEAAQWKAHAKLGLEMRGIFGRSHLQEAIVANHGAKINRLMLEFITDVLTGSSPSSLGESGVEKAADWVRGWTALTALGGNVGVMLKQTTSIPAFGFEIGLKNTARHIVTAFTPDGIEAMRKIWNSTQRKVRWDTGSSEAVANALRSENVSAIKKFFQASMVTNKLGDAVPGLIVGQGILRDLIEQGMSEEDAMAEVWMLIERTQQSSRLENQTKLQRRNKLGRLMYQFMTTQQQYLSYEIKALRELMARPGFDTAGKFASTVALNHFILSSLYYWMGQLYNALLGQEPPEDQFADWMIANLMGPLGSLFVLGFMCQATLSKALDGYWSFKTLEMLPMEGMIKRNISDGADLVEAIFDNTRTWDDVLEEGLQWLNNLVPAVRDIRKIDKNYIRPEAYQKKRRGRRRRSSESLKD